MAHSRACSLLLLLLAGAAAADAAVIMEHSLDGGKSFVKAGEIAINALRRGATAVLERTPLSSEQQHQLSQLIESDGLYRARLPAAVAEGGAPISGSQFVTTSFPARCLAAAAANGGLVLDLLDAGHIASIAVSAPCSRAAAATATAIQPLPGTQQLQVHLPAVAPDVLPLLVPGQQAAATAAAAGLEQDPAMQQGGQQQGQGAAGGKQAGGKQGAKEEDKTWLQKNWMLLMPLGFILMNLLGNGMGGQQQQQPGVQQRPGAAAVRAGAARR